MKIKLLIISILGIWLSSCNNAMSGLGSQTSDDYFIIEATKANNAQNFDGAINILTTKLSASGKATAQAKELLASAYAGKCGLNFINYTTALASSTTGTAFQIAMKPFIGVAVQPAYCLQSLQTMDTIGAPAQRTANENTFAAITGLVMMGASLRSYADPLPVATNGDGVVDVNICTNITDNQMNDIIVGYGYFTTNFSYVPSSLIGTSSFGSLTTSVNLCNSVSGAQCAETNKANVTAVTRAFMRDLINTVQYGIGPFSTGGNDANIPNSCP